MLSSKDLFLRPRLGSVRELTLGPTVPGCTWGAASVAGVGGIEAYERLASREALAAMVWVGRTARADRAAAGTARRRAEVAGTPRERVAVGQDTVLALLIREHWNRNTH